MNILDGIFLGVGLALGAILAFFLRKKDKTPKPPEKPKVDPTSVGHTIEDNHNAAVQQAASNHDVPADTVDDDLDWYERTDHM